MKINFHTRMGFQIEKGDSDVDGILVHTNYDGPSQARVLFITSSHKKYEIISQEKSGL